VIRAVLDTNVIVSSVIGDGAPAILMRRARAGHFAAVISGYILEEMWRVMVDKFAFDEPEVEEILLHIANASDVVPLFETANMWCGDTADNPVVETAIQGKADVLVTGDKRLLATGGLPIRVVTAAAFLAELDHAAQ